MSRILICGAAGYSNLGDDAILEGMLREIRDELANPDIAVVGGPALAEQAGRLGIAAREYEPFEDTARAVAEADLVIIGGGGLLYDSTFRADPAVAFTDRHWLFYALRLAITAELAHRPLMLYGLGVGPLLSETGLRAARLVGERAAAITVRDVSSAELLRSAGVPQARIHVAADPALSLATEPADELLAAVGLEGRPRPWIGFNLRRFGLLDDQENPTAGLAQTLEAFVDFANRVRAALGGTLIGIPFQLLHDDDAGIMRHLVDRPPNSQGLSSPAAAVVLDAVPSPGIAQGLMARLDAFVGTRLHSLILAANAGTPVAGILYDPKVADFMADVGQSEFVFRPDRLSGEMLLEAVRTLLRDREAIASRLRARREELAARARTSAQLARLILKPAPERPAARPTPTPGSPRTAPPRVLMQIRPDYLDPLGGDSLQLLRTREQLQALGVPVDVSTDMAPNLDDYDVVHVFNLTRPEEPYQQALHARQSGKPVALSTIYWDFTEFEEWGEADHWELPPPGEGRPRPRPSPPPSAEVALRRAARSRQQALLLELADLCLPNSQAEADLIGRQFGLAPDRFHIVPNAVDDIFFAAKPDEFVSEYGLRDFVLCAGRVEKRKNQLALVAALRDTGMPLVIVGQTTLPEYGELCRRYAGPNTLFVDALPPEKLASAYAAARVHALASWFETPGLVSLEAAAAGCRIVSTDRGSTREYFGDLAWYCDPTDLESIRRAVLSAYEAAPRPELRELVRERYTWRRAAEATLAAYERLATAARGAGRREAAQFQAFREYVESLNQVLSERDRQLHEARSERNGLLAHREELVAQIDGLKQMMDQAREYAADLGRQVMDLNRTLYDTRAALQGLREEYERVTHRRLYRASAWLALRLRPVARPLVRLLRRRG